VGSLATTDRHRGRPRGFDEEAVLDALMELFAEKGFEAASLADIVEVAGLNKSSLYNAFGSKEELFERALRRYISQRQQLLEMAASGEGGIDDVLAFIDLAQMEAMSESGRRGCLAVNSTAELGFASEAMANLSQEYRAMMRAHITRPLERAAALGEIDAAFVAVYAETILSFMLTAMLSARGGAADAEMGDHFDALRTLVASWRTD
jgi:AcrR family transcriptional regulator